jgi:RNA recognition motif-containing protein
MRLARGCLRATHTLTHTVTRTLTTSATSSLFVHNLSFDVTEEALARHVSKVVTSERVSEGVSERVEVRVELHRNKRKKPTGTAVVYFECVSDAVVAERCLQGSRLYGRELRVREDLGELLTHSLTPHSSEEVREGGSDMASKSVYVG